MMALVRLIYDFFRKEELRAFDYIRKHPRAKWIIGLDAILSISLVFSGFTYASQSSKNEMSAELKRVGAVAMSPTEFVNHVRREGNREYWLGEIPGFDIAAHVDLAGVSSLSYVKRGSDPHDLDRPKITVVTYTGSINRTGIHQFGTWLEPTTSVTASGLVVKYDLSVMMDQIVAINGTTNIVSIHYPTAQTLQTFMENAAALRLVG
ncbi:MAG: hypothetical protein HY050_00765 [Actinobacteria bacterium]|nr:hypothetical protein [Actinomycetota bacterium]